MIRRTKTDSPFLELCRSRAIVSRVRAVMSVTVIVERERVGPLCEVCKHGDGGGKSLVP